MCIYLNKVSLLLREIIFDLYLAQPAKAPSLEKEKEGIMNQISIDKAAAIMGVSSATIRNWVKAGLIQPINVRPIAFSKESVALLKNQISSGSLQKLQTRANKAQSKNNFIPLEYNTNSGFISTLNNILEQFKTHSLVIEPLLFLATICRLEQNGELKRSVQSDVFDLTQAEFTRVSVRQEMLGWQTSLGEITHKEHYEDIYNLLFTKDTDDVLGILYQSLRSEGYKSNLGSYYTPTLLVQEALQAVPLKTVGNFLDPCCGTGKYLIEAAKTFSLSPESIYGFDIDHLAVQIARINLLMHFDKAEFAPNIFCLDALSDLANGDFFCNTNHLIDFFDLVATNPPWGAYKNSSIPVQFQNVLESSETYSMFILKSMQLLKKSGALSFILPESILKIRTHSDIREFIVKNSTIVKIIQLGRQFSGVFTPVIRLDIKNDISDNNMLELHDENNLVTQVGQSRFLNNADFIFDTRVDNKVEALIQKIYAKPHSTLQGHSQWALGIVTGDNSKYLLEQPTPAAEAIFRGSDISPFCLTTPKTFIEFTPNQFQQVAPEKFFRASEKLVYKFISKKLVFAFDNTQALTLNSANILIPKLPNMSIKVAMAFLNSSVFQFLFTKKFATHKVLRGDLEKLPFPNLEPDIQTQLEQLVNNVLRTKIVGAEINDLIFQIFGLTQEEKDLIEGTSWKS